MTQLVITLKDQSYLPNIRRIVKSLKGVESVSVARKKKTPKENKSIQVVQKGSSSFLKGLVVPTNMNSQQLIDEYLTEKYGL
ncbi:MAG: hypothetical protein J5506_06445 [Prevotella sp.]|nr:hypothetical protein [Prevotella sp.]